MIGVDHTLARNVKYCGGLQSFIELVPIRPNPITLAHCKMLPAIPICIQDISSKGFFPNRSVVNLYKCWLEYKKKSPA